MSFGGYDRGAYLHKPAKGNLSNYGRDRQHRRRDMPDGSGKNSGDGSEGAPQVYVRVLVDVSYDKPRPDPDGSLRRECGAAIRREIEKALTGDLLAAKLGDATVTLRAMVMRQEDSPETLGKSVGLEVAGLRFEPGPQTVPNPTHEQARPSLGIEPAVDDQPTPVPGFKYLDEYEDEDEVPPNAGSVL